MESVTELQKELDETKISLQEWESMPVEKEVPRLAVTCHRCCCYKIPKAKIKDFPQETPFCQCKKKTKSDDHQNVPHSWNECPTKFRQVHKDAPKLRTEVEIKKKILAMKKKICDLSDQISQSRKKSHKFDGTASKWSETIKKIRDSTQSNAGNGVALNSVLNAVKKELDNHIIVDENTNLDAKQIEVLSQRVLGISSRNVLINQIKPESQAELKELKKVVEQEDDEKRKLENEDPTLEIDEQLSFAQHQILLLEEKKKQLFRKRESELAKKEAPLFALFPQHRPKKLVLKKQKTI